MLTFIFRTVVKLMGYSPFMAGLGYTTISDFIWGKCNKIILVINFLQRAMVIWDFLKTLVMVIWDFLKSPPPIHNISGGK